MEQGVFQSLQHRTLLLVDVGEALDFYGKGCQRRDDALGVAQVSEGPNDDLVCGDAQAVAGGS